MRDQQLRQAVHKHLLRRHHANPKTLVLDELGIDHGRSRIDVAVVNGHLGAFEIKAQADDLTRLHSQIAAYGEIADTATLVVARKHLQHAGNFLPDWWGVVVVDQGPRGGIRLTPYHKGGRNPAINPLAVAKLLWKPETQNALERLGVDKAFLRKPRVELYRRLTELLTVNQLRLLVRTTLKERKGWRCPA